MKYIITESQYFDLMEGKSEISERCWKGYTQKGMKTMFGKRYPNCVKIKKKKSINEQEANPSIKRQIMVMLDSLGFDSTTKFFGGVQKVMELLGDDFKKWVSNNEKIVLDSIWKKGLEHTTEFFGGRDNLIKLIGLKKLIKFLIYFYNNPEFYGNNFYFICDYGDFDEYLDGLIFDAHSQHEISMDDFFGGIGDNFKSLLITIYGDELKSFWNQKRNELCAGQLVEQLFKNNEEYLDFKSEYDKVENVVNKIFDRVFDNLTPQEGEKGYVRWLLPNVPEVVDDIDDYTAFSKNHWGRLWVYDCENFDKLILLRRFLQISSGTFDKFLVTYLNKKFSDVLGDRPIQDVGRHYCNND